jgi:hypothetical protein
MIRGRLHALSLLVLLVCPVIASATASSVAAAPEATLEAIDSCVDRLHPEVDIGYERIASRCPQLVRRLEESGWSRWLPRDWKRVGNDLSAGGLRELRELLSRESGRAAPQVRKPSIARLPAALAELARENSVHDGWWPRTKEWLRDVFERHAHESDEDWLSRLIGQNGLSQTVIELTSYIALLLVVLLAVIIVLNELRVGGLTRWLGARVTTPGRPEVAVQVERGALSWGAVQRAPLAQRPRMLLELIAARLTQESRLPPPRGLTVRELARAARLADEADRERLAQLACMSERVRFSKVQVPSEELEAAVESGRALLERLSPGALGDVS